MNLFEKHLLKCFYKCNNIYYNKKNKRISIAYLNMLNRYYSFFLKYLYGAFIPYKARIGDNIEFIHSFHGIFISQNAIIGNNCKLLHHITIGSNIQKGSAIESPVIGNDVFIGVGAYIIGKTEIGNSCRVGAGAVIVNKTIEANSIVINNNSSVIKRK